jgi:hypothetical protein
MSEPAIANKSVVVVRQSQAHESAQPTGEKERIVSIDVLRGFALLGILPMNIQYFSMIGAAYTNPTAYGDLRGANFLVWFGSHVLADEKFITIFSMLFGAGIVLMTSHVEAAGRRPARLHYRRMGWLILFGLLHGFVLWSGDTILLWRLRAGRLSFPEASPTQAAVRGIDNHVRCMRFLDRVRKNVGALVARAASAGSPGCVDADLRGGGTGNCGLSWKLDGADEVSCFRHTPDGHFVFCGVSFLGVCVD